MKNRNLVPIFSVSGGVLFVMLYNVLLRMGFFVQSYNYTTAGFLGQAVDMMLRGFLVFVLGVYVGSVVPWLLLKKDNDFAPFVVTIGVIVGALVGFVLNSFLSMMTYRILPSLPMLFMVISWILVGLGAFWGGRFACAWETKKSSLFMHRIFIAIVGIIIFASPLILTVKRADFPGEKTSISVRHAWAIKKFKTFYTEAIEYLKASNSLRGQIGEIKEIAPTVGHNSVGSGPGEVVGHFTLEVVGSRSKVIANVEFIYFSNKSQFSGSFIFNNNVNKLEEKTENYSENK